MTGRRLSAHAPLVAAALGASLVAAWALGAAPAEPPSRLSPWARVKHAMARYRPVLDASGFAEVGESPAGMNAEDLQSLCRAQNEVVGLGRKRAEADLLALGDWSDPFTAEKRAEVHRMKGALASFEGDMAAAATEFERGRDVLLPYLTDYPDLRPRALALIEAAGVAHMRRAELDNCLVNPSADRCLFPLRSGGHHHKMSGAETAVERFQSYLALQPDDLEVRWLLNLAYMVLGRHPRDVPKEQLLAPELFQSEGEARRFVDRAPEARLGRMDVAGGTIVEDMDGDGLLDVVFSSVDHCSPLRLYHNRGDGTFEDRSEAAGILGQIGGLNIVQTDYDNDGRPDIMVMRGGWEMPMRNSLLRNNPDGTFTDVTRETGLLSGAHATHSTAWADFDNDGWLDVFVGHELTPSQLFKNRGDGTFEDVTALAGVGATAFTKGATWGDYDRDDLPDLYVSNFIGDNFLYRNNGDGTFTDVAAKLSVQKPFMSFPTWFFDYDNDGWLDLFVASYVPSLTEFAKHYLKQASAADTLTLYRNRGDGTFADVSEETGLRRVVPAMGANFGDLDNDGFLDIYLGTGSPSFAALMPNLMLRNDAGKRFLDVTTATGTGHLQKGHAIAFADLDHDGDEDVVLNVGGSVPSDRYDDALFENPGTPGHRWLAVRLIGKKSNRAAIGARITVTLRQTDGSSALRYREVSSGGSFGATSLTQHIGLGRAAAIESLEVRWPTSRTTQTFRDVPLDRALEIEELASTWRGRPLRRFTFGREPNR